MKDKQFDFEAFVRQAGEQPKAPESVYPVIWPDAIRFKMRHEGIVKSKGFYSALAVTVDGHKEVIDIYFGDNDTP